MDEQNVGVVGWLKAHSTIILMVVVGLVAGVAFLKRNPNSATTTASGIDTTGLETDSAGNRVIYRDVGDTFVNVVVNPNDTQPVASSPPTGHPGGPVEHPIEPTPTPTPSPAGGSYGLLGPNVAVNFQNRTYTSPTVTTPHPIPIPASDPLVQGSSNRVWYIDNGVQRLLTSGYGGPVQNDGVPAAGNTSSSSGSTNQQNSSTQVTRNT
jgi:hypothetical protein